MLTVHHQQFRPPIFLKALLGWALVFAAFTSGCTKPPDLPGSSAKFPLRYVSETPASNNARVENEGYGLEKLDDIMKYVGVLPAIEAVNAEHPVLPPTVLQPGCTHFMTLGDPDAQQMCGTAFMLREYVAHWRTQAYGPPPPPSEPVRLMFLVSPLHKIGGEFPAVGETAKGSPRNEFSEGIFLYSEAFEEYAIENGLNPDLSYSEKWRRVMAVTAAHELGHLLGEGDHLTHPEDNENFEYHDGQYPHGCLMERTFDPATYDYDGLWKIFCRASYDEASDFTKANTCHGRIRARFGLPYGGVSQ